MGNKLRIDLCIQQAPALVSEWTLELPDRSTTAQALSIWSQNHQLPMEINALFEQGLVGVWGRKCAGNQALSPDDRLEVYRPLLVDPKVARRQRFGQQGARTAGLFAKRRAGAKPGY